jgi:hypothetical protein
VINRCGLLLSYDDKESVQDDWTYWVVGSAFSRLYLYILLIKKKKKLSTLIH